VGYRKEWTFTKKVLGNKNLSRSFEKRLKGSQREKMRTDSKKDQRIKGGKSDWCLRVGGGRGTFRKRKKEGPKSQWPRVHSPVFKTKRKRLEGERGNLRPSWALWKGMTGDKRKETRRSSEEGIRIVTRDGKRRRHPKEINREADDWRRRHQQESLRAKKKKEEEREN